MADFPHLKIQYTLEGSYKSPRGGNNRKHATTQDNLNNRSSHGRTLNATIAGIQTRWTELQNERSASGLPEMPDSVPIFLEIDPKGLPIESLKGFGIEVIAEEENGLIIGASTDGSEFAALKRKISNFVQEHGQSKDQAAKLWNILSGERWRLEYILSDDLQSKWEFLGDQTEYTVDLSIACHIPLSTPRNQFNQESDEDYAAYMVGWRSRKGEAALARDDLARKRESELEELVAAYQGEIMSIIDTEDSFEARVRVSGRGLKDIVLNYPYLFDVTEHDPYAIEPTKGNEQSGVDLTFEAPAQDAPKVCIIDGGISEGHKYLKDAIDSAASHSFLPNNQSTADEVGGGGHGTRVAGAVLFGNEIPKTGPFRHICWLQSAKVLENVNGEGCMPAALHPPRLMQDIAALYAPTRLFNLSINSTRSIRRRHMSAWASVMDELNYENDLLFIVSTGNINRVGRNPAAPGIADHVNAGRAYPEYFAEASSKVSNPGTAALSLTVGSIALQAFQDQDYTSIAGSNEPSSFTRSGPGMWNMIKPDVVEQGGDYAIERRVPQNGHRLITTKPEVAIPTVRIPSGASPAIDRDQVGTSFTAPKVTHLAARILSEWPQASGNFIRGLIAQSARWPEVSQKHSVSQCLALMGYGIPSAERILDNHKSRITFMAESVVQPRHAHIYTVDIPADLRQPGDAYEYLVEVTLAYKARNRRTRQGTHSYFSSWVDWISSKREGETFEQFKKKVIQYSSRETDDQDGAQEPTDSDTIKWQIRERTDWGPIKGFKRNDSTLQKDWCYLKSHELPEHLSIAVVGHKGWENDLDIEKAPYALFVSIECLEPEIAVYERIRLENEVRIEATV